MQLFNAYFYEIRTTNSGILLSVFCRSFALILFLSPPGEAAKEILYYSAPGMIPGTTREMKSAGFWISRHPSPDKIILTPGEIVRFNAGIENKLQLTRDITALPSPFSGSEVRAALEKMLRQFQDRTYYRSNGRRANAKFYEGARKSFNLDAVPAGIPLRYGVIVHYAHQRFFPSEEALYARRNDVDFDELQNNALDVGTPVAVLHTSLDGQWHYVESAATPGWVRADAIAFCDLDGIKKFFTPEPFVVVIEPKTEIFLNSGRTEFYDDVRMGTKLPLVEPEGYGALDVQTVLIPFRDSSGALTLRKAYVDKHDVNVGALPYTPRHIIEQAFRLLNAPYGWGGMYGEQDCSRFLQEVFATVGISLPRNSSEQAKVGRRLAQFVQETPEEEKIAILKAQAVGGITVLPMKGHIMLFLGMVGERPFAIHATWAYRERRGNNDVVRVINRVVVTDLSLGEGTKKGSLLKRLSSVMRIE